MRVRRIRCAWGRLAFDASRMNQGPLLPPVARGPATRRPFAARRPGRRLLLAARRHAHSVRRARVPARRERVSRGDDGVVEAARRPSCTRKSSGASARTMRACRTATTATGTCIATTPATNIPSTPPRGQCRGPRAGSARPARERARSRVLRRRLDRGQPRQSPARVHRRHRGPPPVQAALQVAGDG